MSAQFRNLVFKGGGVKGIAYIGAMQVLERHGLLSEITRVGGTSAGAINALLFALGLSIDEQQELLAATDFEKFMDNSFGFVRDFRRLWSKFGWNAGDFFSGWIGDIVENRLGSREASFLDLHEAGLPDLYVIGTNLSTGFSEIFSRDRHADMPLIQALRISMSIPLFFQAVRYGSRDDVFVDGGVMLNYPVKLFDRQKYIDMENESGAARLTDYYQNENEEFLRVKPGRSLYVYNRQTLGLRLDQQKNIGMYRYDEPLGSKPIRQFPAYAKALLAAVMQVQENVHLHSDDWQRTVYINSLDVSATDFALSTDRKTALVLEGMKGAENYLNWFNDPAQEPVNRFVSAARQAPESVGSPKG